jgi:hypothetical protein
MRVFEKVEPDVRMTALADVAADIPGRQAWRLRMRHGQSCEYQDQQKHACSIYAYVWIWFTRGIVKIL